MKKTTWTDDFVKHWKYYLPPSRASPSELHFIKEKIIEKGKQAKILILGSTPEYRNLCGEINMPVTLLDFSRRNYEYLTREVKNNPKETFVEGNWCDAILPHRFDIILGDNAINVVLKKDQLIFLKNVASMLNRGGYFLPRSFVMDESEKLNINTMLGAYRQGNLPLYTATVRDLFVLLYDHEKDYVHFRAIDNYLTQLYHKKRITKKELDEFARFSFGRDFYVYVPLKKKLDKLLSRFFSIKSIFYGT